MSWKALKVPPTELRLEFTLPTGQSFRWRRRRDDTYLGVVRDRVFHLKQTADDVHYRSAAPAVARLATAPFGRRLNALPVSDADDAALLRGYFNLGLPCLDDLCRQWCPRRVETSAEACRRKKRDGRFAQVAPYFQGARVLRQDPLECLFEFIASSNNNIPRIEGMVAALCRLYGRPLSCGEDLREETDLLFGFPSLTELHELREADLRERGFGYRAKYMAACVRALRKKEGGGEAWLNSLRSVSYDEASEQLCRLPGVGPKVAACVCLFALDKHQAVPVDTHVHQLALKYYTPELEGKSLTKTTMRSIEACFGEVFGGYAGWAHNVLFVAELASHQQYLPKELRTQRRKRRRRPKETEPAREEAVAHVAHVAQREDSPTSDATSALGVRQRRGLRSRSSE